MLAREAILFLFVLADQQRTAESDQGRCLVDLIDSPPSLIPTPEASTLHPTDPRISVIRHAAIALDCSALAAAGGRMSCDSDDEPRYMLQAEIWSLRDAG